MFTTDDTIAAIASGAGGAARGIVRLSGPQAIEILARCFTPSGWQGQSEAMALHAIHRATVVPGAVSLAGFTSPLPCDLYLWPDARSYTRQPSAELHTFGSPPLLEALVTTLCSAGARPARPGEFTLRAFLAGRLDLTQAEAVLGVVDAADQKQLDVALRQMAGGLAKPLHQLRGELLDLLAHLEAGLDFVEEPIEFISRNELLAQLAAARAATQRLLEQTSTRGDAAVVPRVVLVGEPNVGKSSLFNALAGRTKAIVSPIAGTTRDYLTARLTFDDVVCDLVDTAGLEERSPATQPIAAAAQAFTGEQVHDADVRLFCLDASRSPTTREAAEFARPDPARIAVWTKADLAGTWEPPPEGLAVSVVRNTGLAELRQAIRAAVVAARASSSDVVTTTAVRCRDSLHRATAALSAAVELIERRGGEELIAVEIRSALDELGQVVGAVYTDDILDRIFSRFCIGK